MNIAITAEAVKKMEEHIPVELSPNNIVEQYMCWHYKMEVVRERRPKWYEEARKALEEYQRNHKEES